MSMRILIRVVRWFIVLEHIIFAYLCTDIVKVLFNPLNR